MAAQVGLKSHPTPLPSPPPPQKKEKRKRKKHAKPTEVGKYDTISFLLIVCIKYSVIIFGKTTYLSGTIGSWETSFLQTNPCLDICHPSNIRMLSSPRLYIIVLFISHGMTGPTQCPIWSAKSQISLEIWPF